MKTVEIEYAIRLSVEERLQAFGVGAASFTVDQFCTRNHISRARLYNLWREGRGPRRLQTHPEGRITITAEAERDWQLAMEAATPQHGRAA